ncbi:hypothetical protein RDI58_009582 [Solanum bulbocastanum]|uniref:Beta-fructofuranosidase n=1 Tax=Solanum bulbocastanum TaxID=147425 RepID=A0AAN8TRU8_SOLBU
MSFSTLSLTGSLISGPFEEVTPAQATAVMDLIEGRWEEWIGEMPLKITYPALEGHEWRIVTGFDPKNTGRSYLIGESWPESLLALYWLPSYLTGPLVEYRSKLFAILRLFQYRIIRYVKYPEKLKPLIPVLRKTTTSQELRKRRDVVSNNSAKAGGGDPQR